MIIDTSGLLCCFDEGDARHDDAVTFFQSAYIRLTVVHEVTTERSEHSYVLSEFVALCQARGINSFSALVFAEDLLDNPHVEVVWVDETLHRSALKLLQERLDKTYSLCDAVSFVLMHERGITEALTTDRHFEQERFIQLLKP